jgi:NADH-quinone oxidoreductase subunit N
VIEKIQTLWPEITLFAATCVVLVVGLSSSLSIRKLCGPLSIVALLIAGVLAWNTPEAAGSLPNMAKWGKLITAGVGILLIVLMQGVPDRKLEADVAAGRAKYNAIGTVRAEYYAFTLFSLMGLMLCAGADNLIMLFLALELTSLPTYVMVALSTNREKSMEASVKYFFLGALGAAIFLFGFTFIYGGTGTVDTQQIAKILHGQLASGGINPIAMAGLVMTVLGLCFKIAAVPMHAYTADVYQGAASPVAAMLAFVPKSAGFFALITILSCAGWGIDGAGTLPSPLAELLTVIAILTMTVGNVLALLQSSVKRILAYSSIAHSGYMLVGLIAGPGKPAGDGSMLNSGLGAVMLYLLVYGITNVGSFAVLGALEKPGADGQPEEADDLADIRGLRARHSLLAWVMAISALGLMGFPPLMGFLAKLPLFTSGIAAGQILLVIILGINSAIAAFYYLRLVIYPLLEAPDSTGRASAFTVAPFRGRVLAGVISSILLVALAVWPVTRWAKDAGMYRSPSKSAAGNGAALVPVAQPATMTGEPEAVESKQR